MDRQQSSSLQEDPQATGPLAFAQLLAWLDDGRDSNGETYLEVRRRLVAYFDRRNRTAADDLADETLNRVARTLAADGAIAVTPPARYCYVVARFVLLEDIRRERTELRAGGAWVRDAARHLSHEPAYLDADTEAATWDRQLDCLDRCLQDLKSEQRELAIEYHRDSRRQKIESRQALANRLGITMNALAIRASRIRAMLEACVSACRRP